MQQERIRRAAEIAYIAVIAVAAVAVWREASALPPAPYDPLGPRSFPIWVSCGLVALVAVMALRLALGHRLGFARQSMVMGLDGAAMHELKPWIAALTLLLAFAYAAALSIRGVPFLPTTAVYLFLAGAALGPLERRRLVVLAVCAAGSAVILDLLFRVMFNLDLT